MQYTLTILENDFDRLSNFLFDGSGVEKAAYLLCKTSISNEESRFLVRHVILTEPKDVLETDINHLSIKSDSFMGAIKKADVSKCSFIFVHSHPNGYHGFSNTDDTEEKKLFNVVYNRLEGGIHGSLVFSSPRTPLGRVWLDRKVHSKPISKIKVLGPRYEFFSREAKNQIDYSVFDRQVLAFGKHVQELLADLTIGVVGCGGTGSAIIEQLIRLGIGKIIISDGDQFEATNTSRVFASRLVDDGLPKVKIMERLAADIGLGTKIVIFDKKFVFQSVAEKFKNCDLIFGCTDDNWGRSILNRMATNYLIPVIDMAVKIDSDQGVLKSVTGRVTTLKPGNACLFCRGRITPGKIRNESLSPDEARRLVAQGYAQELNQRDPSVINFTANIASSAVTEMIHLLTGFMGINRRTSELIYRYDLSELIKNARPPKEDCYCNQKNNYGKGDQSLFLDITWPNE